MGRGVAAGINEVFLYKEPGKYWGGGFRVSEPFFMWGWGGGGV